MDFKFLKGDYVDCQDESDKYLVAQIIEEIPDKCSVKVHFIGWAIRYDKVCRSLGNKPTFVQH